MKMLLVPALLSLTLTQTPGNPQNQSGLEVLSLNVKTQVLSPPSVTNSEDLPDAVTKPNPNIGRPNNRTETENERLERQTNLRVQNMHVLENAKRETPQQSSIRTVYESEVEMKNSSGKTILGFLWAYRASADLQFPEDQEFLCAVKVTAGETKRIKVLSAYPNQKVVKVSGSGAVSNPAKPTLNDVVINQVQFSDGTTWTRPNWNAVALSRLGATRVEKGKCVQF